MTEKDGDELSGSAYYSRHQIFIISSVAVWHVSAVNISKVVIV